MSMFEEVGGGGGGSSKKKKWIWIAVGTGLIAIFLVLRNSMRNAAAPASTVDATGTDITPTVTDTGGYPSDSFGGGISGTGMDQTLATYLAIADQNSSIQMGALNNQLSSMQDQWKTTNSSLQDQI